MYLKPTKLFASPLTLEGIVSRFQAIMSFYMHAMSRAVHLSFQKKIYDGTLFFPAENKTLGANKMLFPSNSYPQKFSTFPSIKQ